MAPCSAATLSSPGWCGGGSRRRRTRARERQITGWLAQCAESQSVRPDRPARCSRRPALVHPRDARARGGARHGGRTRGPAVRASAVPGSSPGHPERPGAPRGPGSDPRGSGARSAPGRARPADRSREVPLSPPAALAHRQPDGRDASRAPGRRRRPVPERAPVPEEHGPHAAKAPDRHEPARREGGTRAGRGRRWGSTTAVFRCWPRCASCPSRPGRWSPAWTPQRCTRRSASGCGCWWGSWASRFSPPGRGSGSSGGSKSSGLPRRGTGLPKPPRNTTRSSGA